MISSPSTVLIRTNAGNYTGIGHLVRCLQLAEQLLARNARVIFVLDFIEPNIVPFLAGSIVESLYSEIQPEIIEQEDAERFIRILNKYQATHVIIDDYRLAKHWENSVKNQSQKTVILVTIDDILREHCCEILVDMKWRGENTHSAYDQLVPKETIKLLGPKYVLLNKQYQNNSTQNTYLNKTQDKQSTFNNDSSLCFTVMFGLGGGGDLAMYQQLIESILVSAHLFSFKIKFFVVLGPLSINTHTFVEQYTDSDHVELLIGKTDLYPYLQQTHLYIGAAGGILYQLLALNIPALTFAIAENQESDKAQLEQLGHYFHLDSFSEITTENLTNFINSIAENYPQILHLLQNAVTKIDAKGAPRVAEKILTFSTATTKNNIENTERNIESNVHSNKTTLNQNGNNSLVNDFRTIELSNGYELRPINDSDINHYLTARNLPSNCQNMIKAEPIPFLAHYSWWFNAQRDSYLLSQQGKPVLYIWHEVKKVDKQNYLIGGWFVCERDIGFQEALLALNWQLEHCQKLFPTIPWVAVIHRENKFVRLLNKYLGFTDIGTEHAYNNAIEILFNGAQRSDFHFVTYCPDKQSNP